MAARPPLTAEEKQKSYAKYYDRPLAPIPQEKLNILAAGPVDPAKALTIQNKNDLFKPGYLECEIGYCILPDGTGFVANLTEMPGVSGEMFDWWMAWHSLDDLRYKIWDPEDHFYARAQDRDQVLNAKTMPEKTWGVKHTVLEDIGMGADDLIIAFEKPADVGYDQAKVGTNLCSALICANGYDPKPGPGMVAFMTHFVRDIPGGCELRSRFWMGYQIQDGKVVRAIPEGVSIPEEMAKNLLAHNCKEYSNLAVLLPSVYAEEKDNW